MESYENQYNLNKLSNLDDLRGLDLSGKDFKGVSVDILEKIDFDSKTKWPDQERMPNGFNPEALMESGKNPGLGIMELHKDGIDGKGVKVAIIDQTLSSNTGELMKHREYISQITDYHDYGSAITENVSMHGPAVASLFVGKTCGVAPGSELVYRAVPCGNDLSFHADALLDIVERNRSFPPKDKVRIVSCSYGYMEDKPRPGLDRWMKAIEKAEAEGIIVSDVGDRTGVDYIGGGTSKDKENIDDYDVALFFDDKLSADLKKLIFEKDIEGLMEMARETRKEQFANTSDVDLRKMMEEFLNEKRAEIIIPSDYRTMASNAGSEEFMYNGKGAMSWAVPYLSGLFALALQVDPNLTKEMLADHLNKTVTINKKGLKVVNPKGFIEACRRSKS